MGTMLEQLPKPILRARRFGARCLYALTDQGLYEACGVRIAFTGRSGGVSDAPYEGLNLGSHVGDNPNAVIRNRQLLLDALDGSSMQLVVPNQVHGDTVVTVSSNDVREVQKARSCAEDGADALVVQASGVAALLCFADCVPVIAVSPTGRFAVAHAGWRGVMNGVAAKAVRQLQQLDLQAGAGVGPSDYNVYMGPHIRSECFQTGLDVLERFCDRYGRDCVVEPDLVSMVKALFVNLQEAGVSADRIADAGICTKCNPDLFYSYRAENGLCGRHGAIAFLDKEA